MGKCKGNNQENKQILHEVAYYRDKIIEMVNQIENEKFLKRIYISLKYHLTEKE